MKKCCICKVPKDEIEFNFHAGKAGGRQSACKSCNRERSKSYYRRNLSHHKVEVKRRKLESICRIQDCITTLKKTMGCSLCDEKEPCCLDFHHMNPDKEESVSHLMNLGARVRVIAEIKKCSLVCSNCHRKIHKGIITPILFPLQDFDIPKREPPEHRQKRLGPKL